MQHQIISDLSHDVFDLQKICKYILKVSGSKEIVFSAKDQKNKLHVLYSNVNDRQFADFSDFANANNLTLYKHGRVIGIISTLSNECPDLETNPLITPLKDVITIGLLRHLDMCCVGYVLDELLNRVENAKENVHEEIPRRILSYTMNDIIGLRYLFKHQVTLKPTIHTLEEIFDDIKKTIRQNLQVVYCDAAAAEVAYEFDSGLFIDAIIFIIQSSAENSSLDIYIDRVRSQKDTLFVIRLEPVRSLVDLELMIASSIIVHLNGDVAFFPDQQAMEVTLRLKNIEKARINEL